MATFKKCPWTPEEDMRLVTYISRYGIWNWSQMPTYAGLSRSGKSCRLRWMNYLDPQVKRGNYTQEEDEIIINMRHIGAGWSAIAARLPGRTDNEIKNRWHTHLKKQIANNISVESMEQIEAEIDTIMSYEYPNEVISPEAFNLEEPYEHYPMSSYMDLSVESMEPYMEQIGAEIDTIMNYDYPNELISPEAPNLEEAYEHYPISSSYMLSNIVVPPAFETSADSSHKFLERPIFIRKCLRPH